MQRYTDGEKMSNLYLLEDRENSLSIKWNRYPKKGVLVLGTADMDFMAPNCIKYALTEKALTGSYAYEFKSDSYYDTILDWFHSEYNWKIEPHWLTNSPGMWALFYMCIQAFSEISDSILIHAPHFHPAIAAIEGSGRRVVTQKIDCSGESPVFDSSEFERVIIENKPKIFFLVNPHNPTGKIFTLEELTIISEICHKYGVIVLSDEIHGLITYDNHQYIPYASINEISASHSVVLTSPSKAFNIQGLTYAIGIVPSKELHQRLERVREWYNFEFATNIFSTVAVEAAYAHGKPWLTTLNTYLQKNLDYMSDFLRLSVPEIKFIRPQGGYMAWLDFSAYDLSSEEVKTLILDKANVGLTWGEVFGPEGNGYHRVNFGCSRATLSSGLNRISEVFTGL
jgi:cysteine-S-conjugate beta-lyase